MRTYDFLLHAELLRVLLKLGDHRSDILNVTLLVHFANHFVDTLHRLHHLRSDLHRRQHVTDALELRSHLIHRVYLLPRADKILAHNLRRSVLVLGRQLPDVL